MPAIADVVTLPDGSIGVISEELPRDQWRVEFPDATRIDVTASQIQSTLSALTYSVGADISVWPNLGVIESVAGESVVASVYRTDRIKGVGQIEWLSEDTIPLWRVILDNDTRLQRVY